MTGFLHQREVCMDICSSLVLIRHIKGSIYVDDVTLTVDKKSVVKQNYENGKTVVAGIILTDQKRNIHLQLFHSQEKHWM